MNKKIFFALLLPVSLMMNCSDDDDYFPDHTIVESEKSSALQHDIPAGMQLQPGLLEYYGYNNKKPISCDSQVIHFYQKSIPKNHIHNGQIGRSVNRNQNNDDASSADDSVEGQQLVRANRTQAFFDNNGELVSCIDVKNNDSDGSSHFNIEDSHHYKTTGPMQPATKPVFTNHRSLGAIGRNAQNNHVSPAGPRVASQASQDKAKSIVQSPIENAGSPVWSLIAGISDNIVNVNDQDDAYLQRLSDVVTSRGESMTMTNPAIFSQPSLGATNATATQSVRYVTPIFFPSNMQSSSAHENYKQEEREVFFVEHGQEADEKHRSFYGRALGELMSKEDLEERKP